MLIVFFMGFIIEAITYQYWKKRKHESVIILSNEGINIRGRLFSWKHIQNESIYYHGRSSYQYYLCFDYCGFYVREHLNGLGFSMREMEYLFNVYRHRIREEKQNLNESFETRYRSIKKDERYIMV